MDIKKLNTENDDLKSSLVNKILELQGSSIDAKGQITTLVNFIQSLLNIETVGVYTNYANEQINLLSSKAGAKQFSKLGHVIETIATQIDVTQERYYNSLIPISELNISNLSKAEENTYVYPIVSPHAKQIYGVIILTSSEGVFSQQERRVLLFGFNYITKIIEEADLASQVDSKDDRLKLLSQLSSSLRGTLKSEKSIQIVLSEIHSFLRINNIYFARFISDERIFEVTEDITSKEEDSLKGFTHKIARNNPLFRLLLKNQYMTHKNRNVRRLMKVFSKGNIPTACCIIPVIIRNDLLGVIICSDSEPDSEFSTEDLRITQDIAGQLAVMLNQSELYEESLSTAQREFLLNSITTMIRDTLEIDGVLEKTAREVGQVFGVNACGVFLFNDDSISKKSVWAINDEIQYKLSGLPIYGIDNPLMPDPITQSIAISDLSKANLKHLKFEITQTGIKSYLACSLTKGDQTIGLIVLGQFEHKRSWTNSEVQLLEAITDQVEMALSQAELHEHVQQTERQMNLLHEVSAGIRDSLNLSTVMARAAQDLGEIFDSSRCFIRRLRSSNPLSVLATEQEYLNSDHEIDKAADLILEFEKDWLESLKDLPEVERADSILHITDVEGQFKNSILKNILETIKLKSFLGIPLVAAGQVIGSLCIHQCDRKRMFTKSEIDFATRVASEASVAVLNADLFAKVEYQAQRDSLTGLYNHAYFQTALHHEAERAKRTNHSVSVIMVDLDHLKPINDKFGHHAGDEAIKLVAGKLQQCLRQMDVVARYGGDEFAVLLPETNLETANTIAQRILETLNRTIHPQWGALSASLGVSGTPHEECDKEILMKAADDVMYVSKKEGRNRVTSSERLDELGDIKKESIKRIGD